MTAIVLVLAATVVLGTVPDSPVKKLMTPINALVAPVQRVVKSAGNKCSDFWAAITDGVAIRRENEELREEIAQLQYAVTQNEEAEIRYQELKDAFHIKDTFSNYDIFGATVLSRESDEWFSVIRIGLGTDDGLNLEDTESYAVVDSRMNLLGRVIETGDSESKILPLLHEGFVVSGKVNEVNGAQFVISGDASLKNQGLCLVTGIDADLVPEVGAEIVTSGDGGLFPAGIPIGTIESVDTSNPLNITATLRPFVTIDELNDVFVMVPGDELTTSDGSSSESDADVSDSSEENSDTESSAVNGNE